MIKNKKYKSGEIPKFGDLVKRERINIDYSREKCYGIVTGFFVIGKRSNTPKRFPRILWAGYGKPKKSLCVNLWLVKRNEK